MLENLRTVGLRKFQCAILKWPGRLTKVSFSVRAVIAISEVMGPIESARLSSIRTELVRQEHLCFWPEAVIGP